jgi:hypothetical protein
MNQIAKKGDMALVLPGEFKRSSLGNPMWTGKVVQVITDPQLHTDPRDWTTKRFNKCRCEDMERWVQTRRLVPISNPDADVTRTTDREVTA